MIFLILTIAGFFSLRWTKLDPQFPKPTATWKLWLACAAASALVLLSDPGAPLAAVTSSLAVGMITKTAIMPPVMITAEEVPSLTARIWRKGTSAAFGCLLVSALLGLGYLIEGWLPFFDDLPTWFGAYTFACAVSMSTRPISRTLDPSRIDRDAVIDVDISPDMVRQRMVAIAALCVWLLVAFPAIELSFDPDADKVAVLAAVFGGALLVDLA